MEKKTASPYRISPITGEFSDSVTESHFRAATKTEWLSQLRISLFIGAIFYLLFAITDWVLLGFSDTFMVLFAARVLAAGTILLPYVMARNGFRFPVVDRSLLFGAVVIGLIYGFIILTRNEGAIFHALTLILIIIVVYLFVPNRYVYTAASGIGISLAYFIVAVSWLPLTTRNLLSILLLLLLCNVLGLIMGQRIRSLRRSEYAQNQSLIKEMEERIRAENVAHTEEENFRRIFDASPFPLMLFRIDNGKIVRANRAANDLFGILSASPMDLRQLPAPDMRDALWNALRIKGQLSGFESAINLPGAKISDALLSGNTVVYDGTPCYLIGASDISERKRSEAELARSKVEAELASSAKSQFLAHMSHELRTPLNSVIGFSDILSSQIFGPLGDARYKEYSRDINESGRHLLSLINDILDISRIEAGVSDLFVKEINVGTTIAACGRLVSERIHSAGIAYRESIKEGMPPLLGDERRLKQILLNILGNAIKFTPRGGDITVKADVTDDGRIRIEVTDTGIGIAEKDLPRIIQPFAQIGNIMTKTHEGTGLGLWLTKNLVELHGGVLEINSRPSMGTTISVVFPVERAVN